MKYLTLSGWAGDAGLVAIVDDEDYERLKPFKWYAFGTRKNYCIMRQEVITYHHTHTAIANEIMQVFKVLFDHKDRNPLNNQKHNFRQATNSQNRMNQTKQDGCSSKAKGVSWDKRYKNWHAYVNKDGKRYNVGRFTTELEAILARDDLAVKLHGEFAVLSGLKVAGTKNAIQ